MNRHSLLLGTALALAVTWNTAFARNTVRGCDRQWIREVFGFAVVPDLVCYLRIDVETLALRVIESKGMNYWESGMDMRLGADLYDSFKKYQGLIIEEFDKIAEEFGFQVVDARRPPEEIQEALRARILPVLKEGRTKRISKAAAEKAAAEKAAAEKSAAEKPAEKAAEKAAEPAPVKEPAAAS